jgi:hypothetical protein
MTSLLASIFVPRENAMCWTVISGWSEVLSKYSEFFESSMGKIRGGLASTGSLRCAI